MKCDFYEWLRLRESEDWWARSGAAHRDAMKRWQASPGYEDYLKAHHDYHVAQTKLMTPHTDLGRGRDMIVRPGTKVVLSDDRLGRFNAAGEVRGKVLGYDPRTQKYKVVVIDRETDEQHVLMLSAHQFTTELEFTRDPIAWQTWTDERPDIREPKPEEYGYVNNFNEPKPQSDNPFDGWM